MEFTVALDQFEGPLDLMLHLVQKNKLDLFDLDLGILAGQYCSYIQMAQDLNLEIASEYLEEFSWLLEYKSKKLLPPKEEEFEDTYEEDQRNLLAARLQEYQRYKEAAQILKEDYEARGARLSRPRDSLVDELCQSREEGALQGDVWKLINSMKRVLRRQQLLHPYETSVEVRELSVEERMVQLRERLPYMNPRSSLADFCTDISTLRAVIVTFLALLELIHQGTVTFEVDEKGEIWICRNQPKA